VWNKLSTDGFLIIKMRWNKSSLLPLRMEWERWMRHIRGSEVKDDRIITFTIKNFTSALKGQEDMAGRKNFKCWCNHLYLNYVIQFSVWQRNEFEITQHYIVLKRKVSLLKWELQSYKLNQGRIKREQRLKWKAITSHQTSRLIEPKLLQSL